MGVNTNPERPLSTLSDDEKIVLTVLYDVAGDLHWIARVRAGDALTVEQIQELTHWPGERRIGRQRIAAALRSLAAHGLAIRTRRDVYRYRLNERVWVAWGGGPVRR